MVRLTRERIDLAALQAAAPGRRRAGALRRCRPQRERRPQRAPSGVRSLRGDGAHRSWRRSPPRRRRRWPVTDVRIVHRLGRLEIGEASVAVAVASPHRGEAFEACRFAIDTLKKTGPDLEEGVLRRRRRLARRPGRLRHEAPTSSRRSGTSSAPRSRRPRRGGGRWASRARPCSRIRATASIPPPERSAAFTSISSSFSRHRWNLPSAVRRMRLHVPQYGSLTGLMKPTMPRPLSKRKFRDSSEGLVRGTGNERPQLRLDALPALARGHELRQRGVGRLAATQRHELDEANVPVTLLARGGPSPPRRCRCSPASRRC